LIICLSFLGNFQREFTEVSTVWCIADMYTITTNSTMAQILANFCLSQAFLAILRNFTMHHVSIPPFRSTSLKRADSGQSGAVNAPCNRPACQALGLLRVCCKCHKEVSNDSVLSNARFTRMSIMRLLHLLPAPSPAGWSAPLRSLRAVEHMSEGARGRRVHMATLESTLDSTPYSK